MINVGIDAKNYDLDDELRSRAVTNGDLSYAVQVTEGELAASDGPVSLFIDRIGRPLTPVSVATPHALRSTDRREYPLRRLVSR